METVYDKNISNVNFYSQYSLIICFSARENVDKPDQVLFCSSFFIRGFFSSVFLTVKNCKRVHKSTDFRGR